MSQYPQREAYRKAYYQRRKEFYYQRGAIRRARNYDYINQLKKNPCTDCKSIYPVECMDFDHIRGDKYRRKYTGGVAGMAALGLSLKSIEAEVAKCDLVCANCHRIRTSRRLTENGPHSTKRRINTGITATRPRAA